MLPKSGGYKKNRLFKLTTAINHNAISMWNKDRKYLFVHSMGALCNFHDVYAMQVVFYSESHCGRNKQVITPAAFPLCTTSLNKWQMEN